MRSDLLANRVPPIVQGILPAERLSLVGGASGVGKTTWVFPHVLEPIRHGHPVLGYQTTKALDYSYVSCDRPLEEAAETLERIHIPVTPERLFEREDFAIHGVQPSAWEIVERAPSPIVFIEGLQAFVNDLNNYQAVSNLCRLCTMTARRVHKTVLASGHAPKVKVGEGYADPRSRFGGSAAWAGYSSTMFIIERAQPDIPECRERKLLLLPRQAPDQTLYYTLDQSGAFVISKSPTEAACEVVLDSLLSAMPPEFEASRLIELAENRGVSQASLYRWLKTAIDDGKVERIAKGWYRKRSSN